METSTPRAALTWQCRREAAAVPADYVGEMPVYGFGELQYLDRLILARSAMLMADQAGDGALFSVLLDQFAADHVREACKSSIGRVELVA